MKKRLNIIFEYIKKIEYFFFIFALIICIYIYFNTTLHNLNNILLKIECNININNIIITIILI